jgi:hypothetical protein
MAKHVFTSRHPCRIQPKIVNGTTDIRTQPQPVDSTMDEQNILQRKEFSYVIAEHLTSVIV